MNTLIKSGDEAMMIESSVANSPVRNSSRKL